MRGFLVAFKAQPRAGAPLPGASASQSVASPPPQDTYRPVEMTDLVWRVTGQTLDCRRLSKPPFREATEARVVFAPAPLHPHAEERRVDWLQETLRRVAPHVIAVAGPGVSFADGRAWGQAHWLHEPRSCPVVVLDSALTPDAFRETTHHELWHCLDWGMKPGALAVIDRALDGGTHFDGSSYHESAEERRARLYQHYASARDLGLPACSGPQPRHLRDGMTAHQILEYVYNGDAAQAARRTDWFSVAT